VAGKNIGEFPSMRQSVPIQTYFVMIALMKLMLAQFANYAHTCMCTLYTVNKSLVIPHCNQFGSIKFGNFVFKNISKHVTKYKLFVTYISLAKFTKFAKL